MARSEHLPIYRTSYDLCLYLENIVRGFARYHKYGLGSELRELSRSVLRSVMRANSSRDKAPELREMRGQIAELQVLVRLANDARVFANVKTFGQLSVMCTELAKQNQGWLRSVERPNQGPSRPAMPHG